MARGEGLHDRPCEVGRPTHVGGREEHHGHIRAGPQSVHDLPDDLTDRRRSIRMAREGYRIAHHLASDQEEGSGASSVYGTTVGIP